MKEHRQGHGHVERFEFVPIIESLYCLKWQPHLHSDGVGDISRRTFGPPGR
jgi:hypothetical protein